MKYASVMYLNEGCSSEYKKRHDELWPELADHLKSHGIKNYFIYLDERDNRLYATFEADALDKHALADHPVMQRWWEAMADIMTTKEASFEPLSTQLTEVFRFNVEETIKTHVVAVLDIGKTNIKICLMDAQTGQLLKVTKRVNKVLETGLYPHVDHDGIWTWVKAEFSHLAMTYYISSITITTHGATVACMSGGDLAMPILDYEFTGIDDCIESYRLARPEFNETFSPLLQQGLNLGKQLFWLQKSYPVEFNQISSLLLYPQYWGFKLSGNMAAEVTSLGCHTDLWNPIVCNYSTMCNEQGWTNLFPPLLETGAKLGEIRPELAQLLGLPKECVIFNGIHDSNASLVPYLGQPKETLTIISSGTWTVIATINGKLESLDEHKDMLANVDAFGRATPTIRFMGGREWEVLKSDTAAAEQDIAFILDKQIMAVPSFAKGGGPFAQYAGYILPEATILSPAQQSALADVYVALMTDYCLSLTHVSDTVIIEGAFSNNSHFLSLLASLREGNEIYASRDVTGTSAGAALLSNKSLKLKGRLSRTVCNSNFKVLLEDYRQRWIAQLPS